MKKLLFICYKKPAAIPTGGDQCSRRNYDALCSLLGGSGQVTEWYVHDASRRPTLWSYLKAIALMPAGYYYGLTPGRVRELVRLAARHDYVFIDRSLFGIVAEALRKAGYGGRIITFFHNVEPLYFKAKVKAWVPGRFVLTYVARHNDRLACRHSDHVVALGRRDAQLIYDMYGRRVTHVIPIAFADRYRREAYPEGMTSRPLRCVFVGSYFRPNNEGLLWLVRQVMPHVDATLTVVGKGMARLKAAEASLQDVEVVSDAPSLEPYFEAADVIVLPIFSGSGMKVKTCEALMYGKNIIGTREAFEGYDIDTSRVGAVCDTAAQFIDALNAMASTPRCRFNAYSREAFVAGYSAESVMPRFKALLR